MKTTLLYAQVASSENRLLPGLLHYQVTALKLFCYKNEINILKIYTDTMSNKTLKRPGLLAMLREVEDGELSPDLVLVQDWGMLSQFAIPLFQIIDQFYYKHVDVRTTEDFDLQSFNSRMYKFKTSDPKEVAELRAKNIYGIPIYEPFELALHQRIQRKA